MKKSWIDDYVSINEDAQFGGAFKVRSIGLGIVTDSDSLYITQVEYRQPVTIVFWSDGTKTLARCSENDIYSAEAGLMVCVMKKVFNSNFTKKMLNDWLPSDGKHKVDLKSIRAKKKAEQHE